MEEARRNLALKRPAWQPAIEILLKDLDIAPSALFDIIRPRLNRTVGIGTARAARTLLRPQRPKQVRRRWSRVGVARAPACHDRKRRLSAVVRRVQVRTARRKELDDGVEALVDDVVQRRVAGRIDGVDVGALFDREPDCRQRAVLVIHLGLERRVLGQRTGRADRGPGLVGGPPPPDRVEVLECKPGGP